MHFFLTEIVARAVAAYLCFDCARDLRRGLADGKIAYFSSDWVNWLLDWSNPIADRNAAPISYWIQIGIYSIMMVGCLGVAIFGWFEPSG